MTVMKKTEQKDDAVSPVVGVMLMLVVTIIIAAVVAAFATGLSSSTEAAPVASLTVKIPTANGVVSDFQITHNSGDPLPTNDLKISFAWTGSDGFKTHTYLASNDNTISKTGNIVYHTKALFVINDEKLTSDFGNVTLTTMQTIESAVHYSGMEDETLKAIYGKDYMTIKKGTLVEVTIIHIPSGQIIYNNEVIAL